MRFKKTLLLLSVLNLTIFYLNLTIIEGVTYYNQQIIFSSKDSYVSNEFPDNNYGYSEYIHCGNYDPDNSFALRKKYAFIFFDISSIESGWEMVLISLTVNSITKPLDLDIYFINEYWREDLITWGNRPSNITSLQKSLNFTTNGKHLFNLTDLISPSFLTLNIMLIDFDIDNMLLINSKEYPDQETHPQLVFHYPNYSVRPILSDDVRIIILIISCFIGFIYIMILILNKFKTKRISD